MFGRGTCDQKSGLVAQAFAALALRNAGVTLTGDLQLQCVVGEETGDYAAGVRAVIDRGYSAHAAVVSEPTSVGDTLTVAPITPGSAVFSLTVRGKKAHDSLQEQEVAGHLIIGPPKTPRSRRTVPLPSRVRAAITDHIREYPPAGPDGFLFPAPKGGPIRRTKFMRSFWNPAARAADIPVGEALHALRHYYASVLISAGLSVKVVSDLLGHTNAAQTLNTYAHLWPTDDDRARHALDDALDDGDTDTGRTDDAQEA